MARNVWLYFFERTAGQGRNMNGTGGGGASQGQGLPPSAVMCQKAAVG